MKIRKLLATLLALIIILSFIPKAITADDQIDLVDIPTDGVVYTLTYPDGTVVTEKDGNPLTYDDVQEALNEDNWLLLAADLESDDNGEVKLPVSWQSGTIKIVETKVPEGYEVGDEEKVVELEEGQVTFVNPKKTNQTQYEITYVLNGGTYNGSTKDIVEKYDEGTTIKIHAAPSKDGSKFLYWQGSSYQPGDEYVVTGNHTFTAIWENERKAVPNTAVSEFIIHKVDDNGDPVEGAIFDIYGKPVVTYTDSANGITFVFNFMGIDKDGKYGHAAADWALRLANQKQIITIKNESDGSVVTTVEASFDSPDGIFSSDPIELEAGDYTIEFSEFLDLSAAYNWPGTEYEDYDDIIIPLTQRISVDANGNVSFIDENELVDDNKSYSLRNRGFIEYMYDPGGLIKCSGELMDWDNKYKEWLGQEVYAMTCSGKTVNIYNVLAGKLDDVIEE